MLNTFNNRLLGLIDLLTVSIHQGYKAFKVSQCIVDFTGHMFPWIHLQNKKNTMGPGAPLQIYMDYLYTIKILNLTNRE